MRKKILAFLMVIMVVLTSLPAQELVYADVSGKTGSVTWIFDEDELLEIDGTGAMANYSAAGTRPWDTYKSQIKSLYVYEGVTNIGTYALYGYKALASVDLETTVASVGNGAFQNCSGITRVSGGTAVSSIGNYAFQGCTKLISLSSVKNVTSIGRYAFANCPNLETISLSKVTSLGEYAFSGCSSLGNVTLSSSLTTIPQNAFAGCTLFTEIIIPDGVTTIGNQAFLDCTGLTKIVIPNSVTSIADQTFNGCDKDKLVIYGKRGSYAQSYASQYGFKFWATDNQKEGTLGTNLKWAINDGVVDMEGTGEMPGTGNVFFYPWYYDSNTDKVIKTTITKINIGSGITSIAPYAFYMTGATTITIPSTVTKIGDYAFDRCKITNIQVPSSVTSVGNGAFYGLENQTVTFAGAAPTMDSGAFRHGTVTVRYNVGNTWNYTYRSKFEGNITWEAVGTCSHPSSYYVTGVNKEDATCMNEGYTGDKICGLCDKVITAGSTIPATEHSYVNGICSNCGKANYLYGGTINSTINWRIYDNGELRISGTGAIPNYDEIGSDSPWFNYQSKITKIVVESGITAIGDNSFYNFYKVTGVSLPQGLKTIGNNAFSGCTGITELEIPGSVNEISSGAFAGCTALTSITLPNSITTIGTSAFSTCTKLTDVTIPSGISVLNEGVFYNCSSIKEITIPGNVKTIGDSAFKKCAGLETVTIESGVTTINDAAFQSCPKLSKVVVPSSVTSVHNSVFYGSDSTAILYGIPGSYIEEYADENNIGFKSIYLYSGSVGANLTYIIDNDWVLTISGTGEMAGSDIWAFPWYYDKAKDELINGKIKEIIIEEGVTSIAKYSFYKTGASKITLPCTVTTINDYAFDRCSISNIIISATVNTITTKAFYGLENKTVTFEGKPANLGTDAFDDAVVTVHYNVNSTWTKSYRDSFDGNITWVADGTCTHPSSYLVKGVNKVEKTCTEDGYTGDTLCGLCDAEIATGSDVPATGHAYSSEWTTDIEATCKAVGSESRHCTRTGCAEKTDVRPIEKTAHAEVIDEAVDATCTTAGKTEGKHCAVCKETIVEQEVVPAPGHSFSDEWTTDEPATCTAAGVKSKHCTRSGCTEKSEATEIPMLDHSWDNGTETTPATCTDDGEMKYECTVCHATKTETIDALGHSFSEEWTVDVEASCTAAGSKSHHCVREANGCTEKSGETVIPKLNHNWDVGEELVAATCTTAGSIKYVCQDCSADTTETVEALGHSYSEEMTVDEDPTCTDKGSQSYHCTRTGCDAKTGDTEIPTVPHSWDDGTENAPATCTEDGEMEYECTVCHEKETETIAAKGHTVVTLPAVAATCTKAGKTAGKKCSVCEEILVVQNDVAALGHKYSTTWTVDKAATYTTTGTKSHHCTRSGCTAKKDTTTILKLNAITGTASYTKTYSTSAQSFTIDSKAKYGKLKYTSSTKSVTVTSAGKVTIAKSFCGVATITVSTTDTTRQIVTKKITITVKPAAAKISTLKNSAKGTAAITWTKQSYVTGYEINYSTSSSFSGAKTIDVPKYSTVSKSITKLTKGKTYYFRIRAYKTVSGKKIYGAYSAKKFIKISK